MTKLFWFHDFISKCFIYYTSYLYLLLTSQYRRSQDRQKSALSGSSRKPAVKGVMYITKKKPIWDLKMGGGIGEEAVNGGAVLGGTTV